MKDEDLLRYLDGELSPREAREAEAAIEASPDARRKLDAMRQLRDVVAARIEAEVADAEAELEGSWRKIAAALPEPPRAGVWARLREWFDAYRGHVLTGALAASAGVVLTLVLHPSGRMAGAPPEAAEAAVVESLEVPEGSGTILQVPSDDKNAPATTVIWLTPGEKDEQAEKAEDAPI
ncbi:MAG TPA: hypothetical protein VKE22_03475 [Haliangiales bacterium]|nr:hypothetical protein [Haliangiales bacterium]